jgi:hypothetical protein
MRACLLLGVSKQTHNTKSVKIQSMKAIDDSIGTKHEKQDLEQIDRQIRNSWRLISI